MNERDFLIWKMSYEKIAAAGGFEGTDLRGRDLRGMDFRNGDLTDVDFSGADVTGADLRRANLHGANLYNAKLFMADLTGANLSEVNLLLGHWHLRVEYAAPSAEKESQKQPMRRVIRHRDPNLPDTPADAGYSISYEEGFSSSMGEPQAQN